MAFTDFSTKIFPSKIKIGDENTPNHSLHIVGETTSTSTTSLKVDDNNGNNLFRILNSGNVRIGDGNNHDNNYALSVNDNSINGIKVQGKDGSGNNRANFIEPYRARIADNGSDTSINLFVNDLAVGQGLRKSQNSTGNIDFEIVGNSGQNDLRFENSHVSEFYLSGGSGGFASNSTTVSRPLKLSVDLIESTPVSSSSNKTIVDSPSFDLVGRYWDGSQDQRYRSSIRHVMEDNSPTSRIGTSIDNTEILSVKNNERVGVNESSPNSSLDVNGSFGAAIQTVSQDYTASTTDYTILADASSSNIAVVLPAATDQTRGIFNVKKINSANTVEISTLDNDNIDGSTAQSISNQYDSITVHCDGSQYFIL